jgi:hypothetical protein
LVLLVWALASGLAMWVCYAYWEVRLTLRDAPVVLRLPAGLQAHAEIDAPVHTSLDWRPSFQVPVRQSLNLRMQDDLSAKVRLKTHLPVAVNVVVDKVVPLKTQVDLSVKLRSWLPAVPVSLPVTVNLPVHLEIPIRANLPLDLDLHVSATWPEVLSVPIDTTFDVHTHVHAPISVQLTRRTSFRLLGPVAPIPLVIAEAPLRLPFDLSLASRALHAD